MQTSLEHENDNLAAELLIVRPDEIIPLLVANISKTDESNNRVENFLREITSISTQQLDFALEGVNDGWELFVSDGELKMYKMERELEGGIVVDPLKAVHSVRGISAREFIDLFFEPDIKTEWDDTLVNMKTIKMETPHTAILHQVHRRIWPTSQRESLFWSQRLNVTDLVRGREGITESIVSAWMVCNHDTNYIDVPLDGSSNIRVKLTIAMVCQTILVNPSESANKPVDQLTRDDIQLKIIYVAEVHPGGWVPQIGLRQVYKKEYPKFLRQFTRYVEDKVKSKPLYI